MLVKYTVLEPDSTRVVFESATVPWPLSRGELFRVCRSEFGRCLGPMVDEQENEIGWTFIRGNETYVEVVEKTEEPG